MNFNTEYLDLVKYQALLCKIEAGIWEAHVFRLSTIGNQTLMLCFSYPDVNKWEESKRGLRLAMESGTIVPNDAVIEWLDSNNATAKIGEIEKQLAAFDVLA